MDGISEREFPKGSEVELADGRRGVVVSGTSGQRVIKISLGGRRTVITTVPVTELLPVGAREPAGEGAGVVDVKDGAPVLLAWTPLDYSALFAGSVFVDLEGQQHKVRVSGEGTVVLGGALTVSDPCSLEYAAAVKVDAPRQGFVEVARSDGRVCAAMLAFDLGAGTREAVSAVDAWIPARWSDDEDESDPEPAIVGVDTGECCFASFHTAGDRAFLARARWAASKGRDVFRVKHDEEVRLIGFPAGRGDGGYPISVGLKGGRPICVVVDFMTMYGGSKATWAISGFRQFRRGAVRHPQLDQTGMTLTFETFARRSVFEFEAPTNAPLRLAQYRFVVEGQDSAQVRGLGSCGISEDRSKEMFEVVFERDVRDDGVLLLEVTGQPVPFRARPADHGSGQQQEPA